MLTLSGQMSDFNLCGNYNYFCENIFYNNEKADWKSVASAVSIENFVLKSMLPLV